jgi:hypothetical protein
VLDELGLSHATDQDCSNVRYVCECVSRRAAHLVSAGVATLINKMEQENVTVGIDGSVYRFHPHFHDLMTEKIAQLVTPGIKVSSVKEIEIAHTFQHAINLNHCGNFFLNKTAVLFLWAHMKGLHFCSYMFIFTKYNRFYWPRNKLISFP